MSARSLTVVNPLPHTLAHYVEAMRQQVGPPVAGATVVEPDIEIGGRSLPAKLLAALRPVLTLVGVARRRDVLLVVWPVFGLADLALWRALGGRRLVLVHDPVPLRHQYGYGRIGRALGRWGSRGRGVEVVAHTELAAGALRGLGIVVRHVLAHPTLPPVRREAAPSDVVVRVLGQFKSARDVSLLEDLGREAPADWELTIAGRGWPAVPGWTVTDRFLTEEELDEQIDSASVVLTPYQHYFQSGIVTRAYERGVPVVAERHEYVESLYGSDWPGLVAGPDVAAWLDAVRRVAGAEVTVDTVQREETARDWRTALAGAAW